MKMRIKTIMKMRIKTTMRIRMRINQRPIMFKSNKRMSKKIKNQKKQQ